MENDNTILQTKDFKTWLEKLKNKVKIMPVIWTVVFQTPKNKVKKLMHLALRWLLVAFVRVISVMVKDGGRVLLRYSKEGENVRTGSMIYFISLAVKGRWEVGLAVFQE